MAAETKISILDISFFSECLQAISKAIPSCKLTITKDGCECYFMKDNIARCSFTSNLVKTDEKTISICMDDINKLINLLGVTKKYEDLNSIELRYATNTLYFDGNRSNFRLASIKEETISQFIDSPIKAEINTICRVSCPYDSLKDALYNKNLLTNSDAVKYLFKEFDKKPKMIFTDIIDTTNPNSNFVTLHIGNIESGTLPDTKLIIDHARLFLSYILKVDNVIIEFTDKNVIIFKIDRSEKEKTANFKIFTSLLKA